MIVLVLYGYFMKYTRTERLGIIQSKKCILLISRAQICVQLYIFFCLIVNYAKYAQNLFIIMFQIRLQKCLVNTFVYFDDLCF